MEDDKAESWAYFVACPVVVAQVYRYEESVKGEGVLAGDALVELADVVEVVDIGVEERREEEGRVDVSSGVALLSCLVESRLVAAVE
jgi:hypothetical protein